MARHIGPVCKLCRREGEKLFLKGVAVHVSQVCCGTAELSAWAAWEGRTIPPRRASDYLTQLREKQKARRIYGVFERQFSTYFDKAERSSGLTGTNLLVFLESRLDNVVYRLGLAESRAQARQIVSHGHIMLNGRKTDVPSALVRPGDKISIRPESMKRSFFKALRQELEDRRVHIPRWLSLDTRQISATVLNLPARDDIDVSLNEQLIVEYYSR